ncbi:MAG: hypothetical protein F4Y82_02575 [Cenarchaeum sp. SB0665_bin_23]|nr:hypothetical protein [Cenarchaeum sp. SB0665_bin_23]MXZ93033.1 hypothetical protein [Cenarchaeum sp. SB0666_bin_15]MYB47240.1 hypothetical protein [Cenarchaeum sp. SB0662_bin_33]MYC80092.1 hypothetical protein [Cenarchaeum sp. SB0661_bin_35]MYD59368.1 hypothetical protein [Cenarchaeum sp. SB0678_bin_8]MYI51786.1 hypothetical protein [Cenarchaeum sp. SB0673_bin_9]MYJ27684.1 hypothetical protein [Cenarchaeum sp. SB0672_bin_9]
MILSAVAVAAFLVAISTLMLYLDGDSVDTSPDVADVIREPDIIMPTKSSRPGCEEDDTCYIPSIITVDRDYTVSWANQDAAFHSVTSGVYGNATDLFDSGHMEYNDTFTYKFEHAGSFLYHCTLHPWMNGTIIVTE